MKWLILSATAAITLVTAAVPAVHAQMMPGQTGAGPMPTIGPGPKAAAPRDVPPPAVPGAASNSANVAPATITPAEMEPNDELFDAINRGDIVAARDAISRGADLGGRNVLGMTPMELSVDLGRNDISFLLLSMRGDSGRRPPASATAAATAAAEKPQPAKPGKTRQAAPAVAKAATPSQPAAPQAPRLFSGDGGAPNPNAGFLGFDSARR
jgi:hypothetical protein